MASFEIIDSLPAKPRRKGDYERVIDSFLESGAQYAEVKFDEEDKLKPRGFVQIAAIFYKDKVKAHFHVATQRVYLERRDSNGENDDHRV